MIVKIAYIILFLSFIAEIVGVIHGLFVLRKDNEFTKHKVLVSILLIIGTTIQILITYKIADYLIQRFLV